MHRLFCGVSVIPVIAIEREPDAVPLARALRDGGLPIIEIVLRGRAAVAAIAAIRAALPDVVVGAGGLQRAADVAAAVRAGAQFLTSPGMTGELAASALASDLPFLPGVATPSEIMAARALGICVMKLFPAEALGGAAFLRALAAALPGIVFCPEGGIDEGRAADYVALPNVVAVGGNWMAPPEAVLVAGWPGIRRAATHAAQLGRRAVAAAA